MLSIESEISNGNILGRQSFSLEWPLIAWVLSHVFVIKMVTIDFILAPYMVIVILSDFTVSFLASLCSLLNLVHLNSSYKAVRVLASSSEILVSNCFSINSVPNYVNELEIVLIVGFISIDMAGLFTSSTYKFCISYHLLLVLP